MIYKTWNRKIKIEQYETNNKPEMNLGTPEW